MLRIKKILLISGLALLLLLASSCGNIADQLTAEDAAQQETAQQPPTSDAATADAANAATSDANATVTGGDVANNATAELATLQPCALGLLCGPQGVEDAATARGGELAAWQGLLQYGQLSGLEARAYAAADDSYAARLASVGQAVEGGAQLLVAVGQPYEDVIYEAQALYPQLGLMLIDGEPHSRDFATYALAENTYAVCYTEQELGYLAGYALVSEGCSKLGFIGALPTPDMVRCGAGFVQGAAQAATDLQRAVSLSYTYCGLLRDDQSVQNLAGSWYANGVEAIFAAGNFTASVCSAAEAASAYVLAMGSDQYQLSAAVISSATKNIAESVYRGAEDWFDGSYWGGKKVTQGLGSQAVGLAMEHERFNNFSTANLRMLLNRFDSQELSITAVTTTGYDLGTLCGEYLTLTIE